MHKFIAFSFGLLLIISSSTNAQTALEFADSATQKAMAGNLEEALMLYNKALEINPGMAETYHNRGLTYSLLGKDSAAVADFSKTILLIPDHPNVELSYANRGNIYLNYQQYEMATADFKKSIEVNPKSYLVDNKLALCYFYLNNDSLSMNCLDSSLSINPGFEETYFYKGILYTDMKESIKAIENYDKAIAIDSVYESAYYQRGKSKVDVELYKEAINDFNKAIYLSPETAIYYLFRGLAYLFTMDNTKACEDFEQAKKLGEVEKADELINKHCK